jgi:hypothetical protein
LAKETWQPASVVSREGRLNRVCLDTSLRPNSARLRPLPGGLFVAALIVSLAVPGNSFGSVRETRVRYVAPTPTGRADGSDWANAASLKRLPLLVKQLPDGGKILVRADQGPYRLSKPIVVGDRGSDAAVTIRGVDPTGRGKRPLIVGGRTEPYSPATAGTGRPIFEFETGADHLTFERLRFKNVGNGCFVLRGAVHDLTISGVIARNVRRFIENVESERASAVGLVVRRTTVSGFSKGAVRLRNDTHDVLIEDVLVDSERQDGDLFAMGFSLTGTVHDVVFRRVVAMNARDTVTDYRNGDGFVAERGTYSLRFEDTKAIDNMDGGYDIKASDVTFIRAAAWGNKRNFRVWGSDVSMSSIRGQDPIRRGGFGTPAQLWAGPSARFTIRGARFIGGDSETIVFDLEDDAVGVAMRTTVRRPKGSDLFRLSDGAELTLNGRRLN